MFDMIARYTMLVLAVCATTSCRNTSTTDGGAGIAERLRPSAARMTTTLILPTAGTPDRLGAYAIAARSDGRVRVGIALDAGIAVADLRDGDVHAVQVPGN